LRPSFTVKYARHNDAAGKKTDQGDPPADRKLKRPAQPVSARSATGQTGSEHGDNAAAEGHHPALDRAGAEPRFPHGGNGL